MPEQSPAAGATAWHLAHGAHLAACLAVLGARGRQAVVQRDAGAVLSALIVCGLEPHWLAPDAGLRVTAGALGAALDAAPGARAAIVGPPGGGAPCPEVTHAHAAALAADVAALVEVAHAHGAALVVDAARPGAADAALAGGADLVIAPRSSGGERFSRGGRGGPAEPRAALPARRAAGGGTRRVTAALLHGAGAERWLPAAAIERAIALAAGRAAVPVTPLPRSVPVPPGAEAEGRRFTRAFPAVRPGPMVCTPRAAWLAPQERVAPAAAVGRVAAEALTPDPPGVPAVLPGERLVPDVLATLRAVLDAGGTVHGAVDRLATLAVVAAPRRAADEIPG